MSDVFVLILSGGMGSRMANLIPKQFLPLDDKPILLHSVHRFLSWEWAKKVVVVSSQDYLEETQILVKDNHPKLKITTGGKERHDSFLNGMQFLKLYAGDTVLVHDVARPFFDLDECEALVQSSRTFGSASLVRSVTETMIRAKKTKGNAKFHKVIPRENAMAVLTPQAIQAETYWKAVEIDAKNQSLVGKKIPTDLCSWLEQKGLDIGLVESQVWNLKITNPMDMELAKSIAKMI